MKPQNFSQKVRNFGSRKPDGKQGFLGNKKADFMLGEFGVKLVVAILCLIILVGIAIYVSSLFTEDTRQKQAQATIKDIANDIAYLSSSGQESQEYPYRSPADWYIFYGKGEGNDAGKFYLCLCPDNSYNSCKRGGCQEMTEFSENSIKIDDSLQGKKLASKNAEILLIKKSTDAEKGEFGLEVKFIISKK